MKSVLGSDSGCADLEFLSGGKLFLRLEDVRGHGFNALIGGWLTG